MNKVEMAEMVIAGLSQKNYMHQAALPENHGFQGVHESLHKPPYVQIDGLSDRGLLLLRTHGLITDNEAIRVKVLQEVGDEELIGQSALYFHVDKSSGRDVAEFRLGFFVPM